jgi:hypothetical protein
MRDEVLQVPAPGKAAWIVLFGFGLVFPLGILATILLTTDLSKIGAELFVGAALILLVMGGIGAACLRYRDVTLLDDHVLVRATMYRKRIPYTAIRPASLRVADTREHAEFRPWLKTNGVGLPGLLAGHFRLKGWKKAFLLVTEHRVVAFELTDDSWVVFSAASPGRALESIRARMLTNSVDAAT